MEYKNKLIDYVEMEYKNKLILIGGPSCCGKTTLCKKLELQFNTDLKKQVTIISMDSYYKNLNSPLANYDCPSAIDFDLLLQDIKLLLTNNYINSPIYLFGSHCRDINTIRIEPAPVIILEGIFVHNDERLTKLANLTIMIKCEDWKLVDRRHTRDYEERNRTPKSISKQLNETVMPGKHKYIDPYMNLVDLVLDNNEDQHFQNVETTLPYIQQLIDSTHKKNKITPEEYLNSIDQEDLIKLKELIQNQELIN